MADETMGLDEAIHQLRARSMLFLDGAERWTPDTEWTGRDLRMILDYLATCVARDGIRDNTPETTKPTTQQRPTRKRNKVERSV